MLGIFDMELQSSWETNEPATVYILFFLSNSMCLTDYEYGVQGKNYQPRRKGKIIPAKKVRASWQKMRERKSAEGAELGTNSKVRQEYEMTTSYKTKQFANEEENDFFTKCDLYDYILAHRELSKCFDLGPKLVSLPTPETL